MRLEVDLGFGLRHGLLREHLRDQALLGDLALDVALVALAQPLLGGVLALELLGEALLPAQPLLRIGDRALDLFRHLGRVDGDVLPLGFREQQLVVDQLVQHLVAQRVDLRGIRVRLAPLQEQEKLLLHVAREHRLVVDHGRDGIERHVGVGLRGRGARARRPRRGGRGPGRLLRRGSPRRGPGRGLGRFGGGRGGRGRRGGRMGQGGQGEEGEGDERGEPGGAAGDGGQVGIPPIGCGADGLEPGRRMRGGTRKREAV